MKIARLLVLRDASSIVGSRQYLIPAKRLKREEDKVRQHAEGFQICPAVSAACCRSLSDLTYRDKGLVKHSVIAVLDQNRVCRCGIVD